MSREERARAILLCAGMAAAVMCGIVGLFGNQPGLPIMVAAAFVAYFAALFFVLRS